MYNDLTAGGYLTWDPAVEGGVFIDGRLEVYDTAFFSRYLSAFSDPDLWRQQMEAYGINTILLFHRWQNRLPMIRFLARDPGWALVYHDEVAVVCVRTQGNEGAIARAREIFPAWQSQVLAELRTPTSPWQWPVERLVALSNYGSLLFSIGQTGSAAELYEEVLKLRPTAQQENEAHVHIGFYLADKGELKEALEHLEKAAALDPGNQELQKVIRQIQAARAKP
jgi:tetratricopeptide (TPR) repeat protein